MTPSTPHVPNPVVSPVLNKNRVKTKTTDREQASPTTRLHESCLVSPILSSHQSCERAARPRPHHSGPRLQWSSRQCKCQYRETLDMSASRDHSLHADRTFRSKWIRARQVHARPPVGRKATLMGHFAVALLARDAPSRKIIWLLSVNREIVQTCAVQRGKTSNQVQLHTQFLAFGALSPPIEPAGHVHHAFRECMCIMHSDTVF